MAKAAPPVCAVEGAQFLADAPSENDICNAFRTQLSQALAESGSALAADDFDVAIRVGKRGSATAIVTHRKLKTEYPEVTLDVMDRAMTMADIASLASDVAGMMATR